MITSSTVRIMRAVGEVDVCVSLGGLSGLHGRVLSVINSVFKLFSPWRDGRGLAGGIVGSLLGDASPKISPPAARNEIEKSVFHSCKEVLEVRPA